jgi:hypothetical protein
MGHSAQQAQDPQQILTTGLGNIQQRGHYHPVFSLTAKPPQGGKTQDAQPNEHLQSVTNFSNT